MSKSIISSSTVSFSLGVFVGGASSRMGGFPKGLLPHPNGATLIDHCLSLALHLGIPSFLVGTHNAYLHRNCTFVSDALPNAGPLSALLGLLRAASTSHVLALACDMPFVPLELLSRLIASSSHALPAVVPIRQERPEPLCAAYSRALMLPVLEEALANNQLGLTRLLRSIDYLPLQIPTEEEFWLNDWDCPSDCPFPKPTP